MATSRTFHAIALALISINLGALKALAQNCYYPDGSLSTEGDAACSSQGGACCPLNWQCMSSGLCYLENAGYYGRYTCTDQTWQSPDCPQICTHGNTASGNEAILQCSDGSWCCDGNRVAFNCCTKADTNYFSLPKPSPIAFISSVPSPTSAKSAQNSPYTGALPGSLPAGGSNGGSSTAAPNSAQSTSPGSSNSPSSTTSMAKVTHKSVTTGTDGSPSTVTKVVTSAVVGPAGAQTGNTHTSFHHSSSNLGLIVGLAVGIPLALILLAIALCYSVRRMRKSNKHHSAQLPKQPMIEANYQNLAPGGHAPEVDGFPVAPGRTKSGRRSELEGSDVFKHSPAPSQSSWASSAPGYSPHSQGGEFGMGQIPEEPAELLGDVNYPGQYRAYRPPAAREDGMDEVKM